MSTTLHSIPRGIAISHDIWLILRGDETNRVPNPELGQWDRRKGMMVATPAKIGKMKKRRSQKRHSKKFWRYQ